MMPVLPKYEDITDKRVIDELKRVFRGFSFSLDDNVEQSFKTLDQLAEFVKAGNDELTKADHAFKRDAIAKNGAIMARRWFFGYVLDRCLQKASYGVGAPEKIAKAAGISVPYLYQYRKVGSALSIKDAYILGLYDAGWELTRQLSTVEDATDRTNLIKLYVGSIPDFDNLLMREKARAALREAIDQLKSDNALIDSADVKQLMESQNLTEEAPEFYEAKTQLTKLSKVAFKLAKEDWYDNLHRVFGDCFLMEDIYNSENLCADMAALADETATKLEVAVKLLPDLITELKSLAKITPTAVEDQ